MTSQFRNILDQEHILKELAREKSIYRITILKKADPKLIIAICEIIYNILEGNLPLDKKQKELLFKERNFLRKLVEKNKITYKRRLLVQKGGFILPLLLPIASFIITYSKKEVSFFLYYYLYYPLFHHCFSINGQFQKVYGRPICK